MSLFDNFKYRKEIVNKLFISIYSIVSITILCIYFYVIDKGFCLSDEALQYALALPGTENTSNVFNFDLLFKIFYQYFNIEFGIVGVRVLKHLLLFLSLPLVFILGRKLHVNLGVLSFLVTMLLATTGLLGQILSYNVITFYILLITVLVLLVYNENRRSFIVYFGIGAVSFLSFLAKPNVFIGIAVFMIVYISLNNIYDFKNKLKNILIFIFGMIFVFLFLRLHINDFSPASILTHSSELAKMDPHYRFANLLKRLLAPFKWSFVLHAAGFCLFICFAKNKSIIVKLSSFALFSVFISFFIYAHRSASDFSFINYSCVSISAIFIGLSLHYVSLREIKRSELLIYLLLYLSPFLCISGSTSYFFRAGQQYLFFWILLLSIIHIKQLTFTKWFNLYVVSITIVVIINFVNWNIFKPYNQPPINFHFVKYTYRGNKSIYLDSSVSAYLVRLKNMLNNHMNHNSSIVGLYAMPGEILLTGYTNFYTPLLWNHYQWKYHKPSILQSAINKRKSLFVLTDQQDEKQLIISEGALLKDSVIGLNNKNLYLLKYN